MEAEVSKVDPKNWLIDVAADYVFHRPSGLGFHIDFLPADFIAAQINAVFTDLAVGAVKIGMLGSAAAMLRQSAASRRQAWPLPRTASDRLDDLPEGIHEIPALRHGDLHTLRRALRGLLLHGLLHSC